MNINVRGQRGGPLTSASVTAPTEKPRERERERERLIEEWREREGETGADPGLGDNKRASGVYIS